MLRYNRIDSGVANYAENILPKPCVIQVAQKYTVCLVLYFQSYIFPLIEDLNREHYKRRRGLELEKKISDHLKDVP